MSPQQSCVLAYLLSPRADRRAGDMHVMQPTVLLSQFCLSVCQDACIVTKLNDALRIAKSSKKGGSGPPICGRKGYPDFGHEFSNRTHFRACGQFWLSSIQQVQRLGGERKKERRKNPW